MRTTLRRLLVAALFALVGALLIDGTAHAQAGCSSPDPFTALGGGTCYRGGWFPPGMAIPDGGHASPAPPAPSRDASAPSSTCVTPDPFAALGGGTCYRGGWFPPGMAIPDGGSASPASPAPPPGASAPSSTCVTPDPFAALGGGTCYRGGWFPPGMAIPDGGSASPAPPAPPLDAQRRRRHASRRIRSRRSAAGPAIAAAGSRRACRSRTAEVRPRPRPNPPWPRLNRSQLRPERSASACSNGTCITALEPTATTTSIASRHGSPGSTRTSSSSTRWRRTPAGETRINPRATKRCSRRRPAGTGIACSRRSSATRRRTERAI